MASSALMWFRSDLRSVDNEALFQACRQHERVRAIFLLCPQQWDEHHCAPIRRDYERRCINALGEELAGLGIVLDVLDAKHFREVPDTLAKYVKEHNISELYANKEYLLNECARDSKVEQALDIPCHWFKDRVIFEPGEILKQDGDPYQVFSPFARNWRQQLQSHNLICHRQPKPLGEPVAFKAIPPFENSADSSAWPAGENEAIEQLRRFSAERAQDYKDKRDLPDTDGTSRLSPALAVGTLSPRQCLARIQIDHDEQWMDPQSGAGAWLNELVWREFYVHAAWFWPRVVKGKAFQPDTEDLPWPGTNDLFQAWCDGRTGYPIVDAGMRQLKQTGWMHNRVRMIVASFLSKDLQIDWRRGEQFFMQHLIDGDFASNNGGWQWAASTGTDAAPYFRIFNPTTQGQRFDPQGHYIKHFVPELRPLSGKAIHTPPAMDDYPAPVVDHKQARLSTLDLFKAHRDSKAAAR